MTDWYSRKVLGWRINNSMDASFCVDCLEDALRSRGTPEVFNSDLAAQCTSAPFTGVLKGEGVTISMDGRGRAFDNILVERLWRTVKYEDVYLNGHANMGDLMLGLTAYMMFYNEQRFHQALGKDTPSKVYSTGIGGATIQEKYGISGEAPPVPPRSTDGASPDDATTATTAPTSARPKATTGTGQRRAAVCEASTA